MCHADPSIYLKRFNVPYFREISLLERVMMFQKTHTHTFLLSRVSIKIIILYLTIIAK